MTQAYRCEFTAAYVAVACLLVQPLLACSKQKEGKSPSEGAATNVPIKMETRLLLTAEHVGMVASLKATQELCRQKNGLASVAFPKMMTDAYVRAHAGSFETKYYQGKHYAKYGKRINWSVNLDSGCEIVESATYNAMVESYCEISWSAHSDGREVVTDESLPKQLSCIDPRIDPAKEYIGYKTILINGTVPCLFLSGMSEARGIKYCSYGHVPNYDGRKDRGISFAVGENEGMLMELISLTDGTQAIPPDVFSIEGVRTWVSQPTVRVLK